MLKSGHKYILHMWLILCGTTLYKECLKKKQYMKLHKPFNEELLFYKISKKSQIA